MSKYSFERLGPDRFETLVQALLERLYRTSGELVQFGDGKDGAREATWRQPITHPKYVRPATADRDIPKQWVFQAKFHDIGLRGWGGARAEVESELARELDKIVNKYKVPCHHFVLITNVPFSGVRHVGTRDRVTGVITQWRTFVPEIEVWDAVNLSRMLDADPDTRTTYLDDILPGDVLRAFLSNATFHDDRRKSAFYAYLKSLLRSERDAKAEEAGDESGLQLENIFVDLDLRLVKESLHDAVSPLVEDLVRPPFQRTTSCHVPTDIEKAPASFAFLRASHSSMLLKGGPGVGKSTITQYLTLYNAARLVSPDLAVQLARRLKLTGNVSPTDLDAHCRVRFPLRVELRRYAQWMADPKRPTSDTFLARYLADRIARDSSSELSMEDIFALSSRNPILLILDGLDEVPNPFVRKTIFAELAKFLDRCEGEAADIQILLSSRPQGYRGEFDGFAPVEWNVIDLDRTDFDDYANRWLQARIRAFDERSDARRRIDDGMQSQAVQQMATTLLQATVMLTIARRKHPIPHARHKLYEKYVEVIFERERNKQTVRERGEELLRLHELVGFHLICEMEALEGTHTLSAMAFKQCVQQVIADYGRIDLAEESIGSVVEEIVTLAKDRLCLLAGKGEDQEDVDFVIQPFREYFAAAYLAHHEDADPDRVYGNLVKRRHVWANVLQFYAAFQSKAQQKNWIAEADGTDCDQNSYEGLVTMTRKRRALLRVLPEFERPKNEYIQRAFRNLFDLPTRWTWADRRDTSRSLDAFAPSESFAALEQVFVAHPANDAATMAVELDLLIKTAGPLDQETLREKMAEALQNGTARSAAIQVAYRNNVRLSAIDCPIESLLGLLAYRPDLEYHECSDFLGSVSEHQILDLVFLNRRSPIHQDELLDKSSWIRDLWTFLTSRQMSLDLPTIRVLLPPYVVDRRLSVPNEAAVRLANTDSQVGPYLKSLLAAIERPTDPKLIADSQCEERKIEHSLPDVFSTAYQLGPEPSDFASVEDWATATKLIYAASDQCGTNWLKGLSADDGSWLTLVVHPDFWSELKPLIPEDRLHDLLDVSAPIVKALSPRRVMPIQFYYFKGTPGSPRTTNVDIVALSKCVVDIIRKGGSTCVLDEPRVVDKLVKCDLSGCTTSIASMLLRSADALAIPSYWAGLIIRICSITEGADVAGLLELWKRFMNERTIWIDNVEKPQEVVIEKVLDVNTQESTRLAAFLASTQTFPGRVSISSQVSTRVSRSLSGVVESSNGEHLSLDIALLLQLVPDASELSTWANPTVVAALRQSPWLVDRVAGRLKRIVGTAGVDHDALREALGVFIQKRSEFPIEIALAAMDVLLGLDEVAATPLRDVDWQILKK